MSNKMDNIHYNGEVYEIETGLSAEDVRASMSQVFASVANAAINRIEDGWMITERGGDKG
jgi:hypothetical protein